MEWTEAIWYLQEAQRNNRLVVFVGAGVSKNSDIPLWEELIDIFAEKLNYGSGDKRQKSEKGYNKNAKRKYTQEELLRIPEYYSLMKPRSYKKILREVFNSNSNPNDLDRAIIRLLPHHIITTNYDRLLEDTQEVNTNLYTVISKDKDMLAYNNDHYIIKMHGDLNDIDNIVLKESDYIDYEQSHRLISTYIRSLLIDHTFLFVGYSLNDYNLKLIIGWINYLAKQHNVDDRPKNFILQNCDAKKYERIRLKKSNIEIVDLSKMPEAFVNSEQNDLSHETAKQMYCFIESINNPEKMIGYVKLKQMLVRNYEVLQAYDKIAYDDLKAVSYFGRCEFFGTVLMLHEEKFFSMHKEILLIEKDANSLIRQTLRKTGITLICNGKGDDTIEIADENDDDKLLNYWLDNDYKNLVDGLPTKLDTLEDIRQRIYYLNCLNMSNHEYGNLLEREGELKKSGDYIGVMRHKTNKNILARLQYNQYRATRIDVENVFSVLPKRFQPVVRQFEKINHTSADDKMKMQELLNIQVKKHLEYGLYSQTGHAHRQILQLQGYVYDYYMFMKKNGILIDFFTNPKDYFSYYLEAILCSYYIVKESYEEDIFPIRTEIEEYPLGHIDIDMLVKYCNYNNLVKWIKKYSVEGIKLQEGVDIITKFKNFCENTCDFSTGYWGEQLQNFLAILGKIKLTKRKKEIVARSHIKMMDELARKKPGLIQRIFKSVKIFNYYILNDSDSILKDKLLRVLVVNYSVFSKDYSYDLGRMLTELSLYALDKTKDLMIDLIDRTEDIKEKCHLICIFHKGINVLRYKNIICGNSDDIYERDFFGLVLDGVIVSATSITDYYIRIIEEELKRRKGGVKGYPDAIEAAINHCVFLEIEGMPIEIRRFKPYQKHSEYLEFIIDPQKFDYSKIDLDDYMWLEFFKKEKYIRAFKAHKQIILSNNRQKTADNEENSMFYKVVLEPLFKG